MFIDGDTVRTRKISPTEYARAAGLPPSYKLPFNCTDAFNLIGDGLAVPVVRFLAERLLEPLLSGGGAQ